MWCEAILGSAGIGHSYGIISHWGMCLLGQKFVCGYL